ncbi:MAG TPA: glycosyltransferase, partial [Actinomycetota bacterium]|nr:glycosyltransferase [Actinomycetota bacterium]
MGELLRVVFLAHAVPRHAGDLTGGFLLRLAAALRAEGVEVVAVAPSAEGLAPSEQLDGVQVYRSRYAPRRAERLAYAGEMHRRAASPAGALALAGRLGAGALAARRAARGADLVHAHWWFPAGVQALAARTGLPLVTTLHGTDVRLARSRPAARAACARVLRASARVTAVSGWLAEQAAGFAPGLPGPISVAPMPVDDLAFSSGPGGQPRDELLFVGRLDRQKGAEVAVAALARLTGPAAALRLRVVGSGPEEPALRRLAGALGLAGRVL